MQLEDEAPRRLEVAGDQNDRSGQFAEHEENGGRMIALGTHLLPAVAERDERSANIQVLEKCPLLDEALEHGGIEADQQFCPVHAEQALGGKIV